MIVVMKPRATEEEIRAVEERLQELEFQPHLIRGVERNVIGAVGAKLVELPIGLETMDGVDKVVRVRAPYKLVSREAKEEDTVIKIGEVKIGGPQICIAAGPCAVESEKQVLEVAKKIKHMGASILRGGAFKPRTSPYSFQGLEERGLQILAAAREETGLKIVTEAISLLDVDVVSRYADIIQIGARNMQNFPLLKEVGQSGKPVLLKRGVAATIDEWLLAAEYVMAEGNYEIILCERGIRTFETKTRNTLDISSIPLVKKLSHLPVIADPSHAAGDWRLVTPLAKAAIAAGADGLIIETHPDPQRALCDGVQSLTTENFGRLIGELIPIVGAVGRKMQHYSVQEYYHN
jgi:3-deoxy-7-phosphoheptulonate synthase